MTMLKTCRVCQSEKPLDEFSANRHVKSGVNSMCRACGASATSAYRKKHPESIYKDNHSEAGKAKQVRYRERHRAKLAAARQAYYLKNRDRILADARTNETKKAREREYREENREAINRRVSEWQKANLEKCAARTAKYRLANPDAARTSHLKAKALRPWEGSRKSAARRARKLQAMPIWANRFFISEAYHLARLRTSVTGFKWEVDHKYPLKSRVVCGLHVENNLQVIPESVNRSKGNKVVFYG